MNLPEFSVRRRVTTLMVFCAALMIGAFTIFQLPLDLYPQMDIPVISVTTVYEGASPEEIEQRVTRPLEQAFAVIDDVRNIFSSSSEGVSNVTVNFQWGVDLDARANDVRDAIDNIQRRLPEDAERSRLMKFDLSRIPVLVYGVRAAESYIDLERILDEQLVRPLESVSGVAVVQRFVPLTRQVNVDLDREKLAARGLTPPDVAAAIAAEDQEVSAGSITSGYLDYLPRVPMRFEAVSELDEVVVAARAGEIIRLRDVGRASDGFADIRNHILINNHPGAMLMVSKQADANTVSVSRAVRERLPALKEALPADVELVPVIDTSEDIRFLVRDLLRTLLLGGGLAVLAVLIFLRRAKATLIIAMAIPFALLLSGLVMYLLDYTLNTMTLFALIICIGLVIDNSIVILENITRHREEGESPDEGAIYGAAEVGTAIAASTLTTVCIFLPLLFVRGMIRIFFAPFAVIAAAVILASLFSALSITPMFSAWLLRGNFERGTRNLFYQVSERGFEKLADGYRSLLACALRHRWVVIGLSLLLFFGSAGLVPRIGFEFTPREDRAFVNGNVTLPVGTRLEVTREALEAVKRIIEDEVPAKHRLAYYAQAGQAAGGGRPGARTGTNMVDFGVRLTAKEERDWTVYEMADRLRERLEAVAGFYSIEEYSVGTADPLSGVFSGGGRPLTINILGDNLAASERLAGEISDLVRAVPGTVDVATSIEQVSPELWVRVDRQRAAALGLRMAEINRAVRVGIYGQTASRFRSGSDEYDIFVRLREEDRASPESLGRLPLRLPDGRLIRLENIARVIPAHGPRQIERRDQQRIVRVESDISERSVGEVIRDVRAALEGVAVPPGLAVEIAGQAEEISESYFWLSLALLMAMILVYMIMASQFESLRHPLVVMFSLPFAFTGVIWGLFLGGINLSIIVFLGLLMLVGVVVNNAIVLVDYINILRQRGYPLGEAITEAGRIRLRPVLMTAFTTIAAILPMAFARGWGEETWNPLGITIVSGLLVATLVTLVLVPVIYSLFEGGRQPRSRNAANACPVAGGAADRPADAKRGHAA